MRKTIFTLFTVLWAVIAIADDIPRVYNVENTGADCALPSFLTVKDLPSIVRLPNPFAWASGAKGCEKCGTGPISSFADWSCRRSEIKAQIENYEIGLKPPRPAGGITATFSKSDSVLTVIVSDNGKTVTLTSKLVLPDGAGPFPVIIGMDSPNGSLPASIFNGCIRIPYSSSQVSPYGSSPPSGPFYNMYPNLSKNGQYCAWAWGVSRLIDGIEIVKGQLNADLNHIAVTGCSYAGKMALFAGAFDERIALTIAQESGGGGTASWRVSETLGSVENLSSTNYSWFMQSLKDNFDKKVNRLPYDHHELIAMIAPRAFLALGNNILWLADESGYVSCMAAREVYKWMGVEDRIGFDLTGGHDHCNAPASQINSVTSFVKRFLLGDDTVNTSIAIAPYKDNWQFWISDWANGVTEPTVPLEQYWHEAESTPESANCTIVGSDFKVVDDAAASGGKYVTAKEGLSSLDSLPGGSGLINIPFSINNHRDFHIYLRVNCSSDNPGSFWVMIDGEPAFSTGDINTEGVWKWVNIANPTLLAGRGSHYLTIAYRSNGAKLDKVYITNDPNNQAPAEMGGNETECVILPKCTIIDFENASERIFANDGTGWWKQNPGGGIDFTQEAKHSGSYALKMASPGGNPWSVQAFSPAFKIISGHLYNLTFWIRAVGGGGRGRISTTGAGGLGGQYWSDFTVVGDTMQQIKHTNLVASGSAVQLAFDMGYVANKTYYIDDIVLEDITAAPEPIVRVQGVQGLTSWDAGEVEISNATQSGTFEVRNIGTDTLRVTGTTELPAPWSTTLHIGNGFTLSAGQVREFIFTYSPTAEGSSNVVFTVRTNAGDASVELKGAGVKTGIPFVESSDVKIFSPASGKISVTAISNSVVKVMDVLGRTVRTCSVSDSSLEIPVYSGIYIVTVEDRNKIIRQKMIVR